MRDQYPELPIPQEQMVTTPFTRAASCRIRSPYPPPALEGAEAPGAGAPGSAGPGEPTEGGGTELSSSVPQQSAPRRRLRDKQLREHRVHPRYNDDEITLVKNAAALSRMKPGGYVAECALAAARAEDPTAAVADYRAMVQTLMAANRQLGGIGNNLNQLTWHLNKEGAWPHPDTVQRLLDLVEASIAAVDTAVAQITEGR